jgi:hypothetical protein
MQAAGAEIPAEQALAARATSHKHTLCRKRSTLMLQTGLPKAVQLQPNPQDHHTYEGKSASDSSPPN